MRWRTGWIVAAAVGAAAVVVLGGPAWLANGTIRPKIESALTQKLKRKVQIGELSLSVLGGRVQAGNVQIGEAPGFGSKPFATVGEIDVRLNWWDVLHGEFNASSIAVDGSHVRLVRNRQGEWNISTLPPISMPLKPKIAAFTVRDALITLAGPPGEQRADLDVQATNIELGRRFPVRIEAKIDGSNVNGSGSVGPLDRHRNRAPIHLAFVAKQLSAAELARTVAIAGYHPSGFAITAGAVDVKAQISGGVEQLRYAGRVTANRVRLQRVKLGGRKLAQLGMTGGTGEVSISALNTSLSYADAAFRLRDLSAKTNFGSLDAHGHIAPSGKLRFLLDLHLSAAPHKGGLSGLLAAVVRLFEKAKDPELKLEIYGTTRQANVRQVQ